MVRNLDHRVEVTCPILDTNLKKVLKNILSIQASDNVKARILDNELQNRYVRNGNRKVRSQVEIYNYLQEKLLSVTSPGISPGELNGHDADITQPYASNEIGGN
jgi:polyphosphate kinase